MAAVPVVIAVMTAMIRQDDGVFLGDDEFVILVRL